MISSGTSAQRWNVSLIVAAQWAAGSCLMVLLSSLASQGRGDDQAPPQNPPEREVITTEPLKIFSLKDWNDSLSDAKYWVGRHREDERQLVLFQFFPSDDSTKAAAGGTIHVRQATEFVGAKKPTWTGTYALSPAGSEGNGMDIKCRFVKHFIFDASDDAVVKTTDVAGFMPMTATFSIIHAFGSKNSSMMLVDKLRTLYKSDGKRNLGWWKDSEFVFLQHFPKPGKQARWPVLADQRTLPRSPAGQGTPNANDKITAINVFSLKDWNTALKLFSPWYGSGSVDARKQPDYAMLRFDHRHDDLTANTMGGKVQLTLSNDRAGGESHWNGTYKLSYYEKFVHIDCSFDKFSIFREGNLRDIDSFKPINVPMFIENAKLVPKTKSMIRDMVIGRFVGDRSMSTRTLSWWIPSKPLTFRPVPLTFTPGP